MKCPDCLNRGWEEDMLSENSYGLEQMVTRDHKKKERRLQRTVYACPQCLGEFEYIHRQGMVKLPW